MPKNYKKKTYCFKKKFIYRAFIIIYLTIWKIRSEKTPSASCIEGQFLT